MAKAKKTPGRKRNKRRAAHKRGFGGPALARPRKAGARPTASAGSKGRLTAAMVRKGLLSKSGVFASHPDFKSTLRFLADQENPTAERLEMLDRLQAATFSSAEFIGMRKEYVSVLRKLVADPDAELRARALGILARTKDRFAHQRLLAGLKDKAKASVSPEKALQLLGYDSHPDTQAYEVARSIVEAPPNPTARREALRLLASDTSAAPVFERILRDKNEEPDVRRVSAAALQSIEPKRLRAVAREVLMDASEEANVQATCLTALTQFGDEASAAQDKPLIERVTQMRNSASSTVTQSAKKFLERYSV